MFREFLAKIGVVFHFSKQLVVRIYFDPKYIQKYMNIFRKWLVVWTLKLNIFKNGTCLNVCYTCNNEHISGD